MIQEQWLQYMTAILVVLLFISIYFNFRFSNLLKKRKENENLLIRNAYFNPITDLPNLVNIEIVINEQIDRAFRHNQTFLLTVVKIMNYHEVKLRSEDLADKFMLEASDRLLSSIRDEDLVGHITEDSFLIIFNEYLDEDNYDIIIERIKQKFAKELNLDTKYQIEYKISFGHTKYPNDGTDTKLLIDRATQNALK